MCNILFHRIELCHIFLFKMTYYQPQSSFYKNRDKELKKEKRKREKGKEKENEGEREIILQEKLTFCQLFFPFTAKW